MKLLLDEQLAPVIASTLRDDGHDVVAVQDPEFDDWRGLEDAGLWEVAQQEGRAVVTDNLVDFRTLAQRSLDASQPHHGVLYLNNRSLSRHRHELFVGRVVERLEEILAQHPDDTARSLELFV